MSVGESPFNEVLKEKRVELTSFLKLAGLIIGGIAIIAVITYSVVIFAVNHTRFYTNLILSMIPIPLLWLSVRNFMTFLKVRSLTVPICINLALYLIMIVLSSKVAWLGIGFGAAICLILFIVSDFMTFLKVLSVTVLICFSLALYAVSVALTSKVAWLGLIFGVAIFLILNIIYVMLKKRNEIGISTFAMKFLHVEAYCYIPLILFQIGYLVYNFFRPMG